MDIGASTEFSLTRFLVPYLNNYSGYAVFCDSDMVFSADPNEILRPLYSDNFAVWCVKQCEYTPKDVVKMDGQKQAAYPRKNWSSFMVFNCFHQSCKELTLSKVNHSSPAYLHRFEWVADEDIYEVPQTWNYLVGENNMVDIPYNQTKESSPYVGHVPYNVHYTSGTPLFPAYRGGDGGLPQYWFNTMNEMIGVPIKELNEENYQKSYKTWETFSI